MKPYMFIVWLAAAASVAYSGDVEVGKITNASNSFGQSLYLKIASGELNAIFSPFSIHQALSMATLGARQTTRTELTQTLGLDVFNSVAAQNQAYKEVIQQLNNATDVVILAANAIFVNVLRTVRGQFVTDVRKYYLADVSSFDLSDPAGPEDVINKYVENKTEGLIQNLVPPGVIDSLTLAVSVNTLYFNGSWRNPFPKDRTKKADFLTPQGTIQVDTMFDTQTINIKRNFYGADVGELPIGQGRFSFVILLPHDVNGLAVQENYLTIAGRIQSVFEGLEPVRLNISLPKLKIESTFGNLRSPLIELGIVEAFDPQKANFTGINKDGGVYITEVIHKAVIEVNEAGTVAAAATAIVITVTSLPPPPTESFYVNRPFIFFIWDSQLKLILFQGKCIGE